MTATIGVFDSGLGGLSVARAIEKALPQCRVIFKNDAANVPYGTKSKAELYKLVLPILTDLSKQCDAVVIACNTVTTLLIDDLRNEIKTPLIGMEPMIKPAAKATHSKTIAVCATPATLKSEHYALLKDCYAKDIRVLEPDCSDWAKMIETNQIQEQKIRSTIIDVCDQGADIVVLGCTHYHWIETLIKELCEGRAVVLQPEQPVIEQLTRVLAASS